MRFTQRNKKLGAWLLCMSQLTLVAGCNRGGTASTARGSGYAASTAAGSTASADLGVALYNTLHKMIADEGDAGKLAALEARRDDFVAAVAKMLPFAAVQQNATSLLDAVFGLLRDGTMTGAADDIEGLLLDLIGDPQTLDSLAKLLDSPASTHTAPCKSGRNRNMMVSRLLAYPELEKFVKALLGVVNANDGVDANGVANGERNLIREALGMASRQLLGYQPGPNAQQAVSSTMDELSKALLTEQPMTGHPQLGDPAWAVRLDANGNCKVLADPATGRLPQPYLDADNDGVADVGADGYPVDANGQRIAIDPFGTTGARDAWGRALAPGGATYFDYFDVKHTLLSELTLLVGELMDKDVPAKAVTVVDALADRVRRDNGTADPSDDYDVLTPDSPLIDLAYAQFELLKRSPLHDLLRGLAAVAKSDRAKFAGMVSDLMVAMKRATAAAHGSPAAGANQAMLSDLLPLIEDSLRPRGRSVSAMRALLQAFNTKQRQLQNLPTGFARMMRYHDYRRRIPADGTHKSAMQRVLEMMERANQCNAPGMGNMADFYLNAMAGEQKVLGIKIGIGTIHFLLQIGFLRNLLCSGIHADDVRALKDFNDSGALDAMKPIAKVFADRGETPLLKNIMLGLGRHYEQAMRPMEPMVVSILESGSVEKLFEVIDDMTQVRVPGKSDVVADVLADTIQALVDSSTPVYDRNRTPHRTLADMLLQPMEALSQRAAQRNVGADLDAIMSGLGDVLFQTYTDQGTERWKWEGIANALAPVLELVADGIPTDRLDRARWAAQQQIAVERTLTGRDVVLVLDIFNAIAASPDKDVIRAGIVNLFTPRTQSAQDAFGGVLLLASDLLAASPSAAPATVDPQALADVLHFVGAVIDPDAGRIDGIVLLVRKLIAADGNLFLLQLARNAFDAGPNGTDPAPIAIVLEILDEVDAAAATAAPAGPMTADSLKAKLQDAYDLVSDPVNGLRGIIARFR